MRSIVSIIIPIFNSENYLEKCINSIINQSYKDIEVILINDGSTDSSLEICEKYAIKDKRIKIINKENTGVSNSRNIGINNAKGKYIFFIDSDDYLELDCIQKLIEKQKKDDVLVRTKFNNDKSISLYNRENYLTKIASGEIRGVSWGYLLVKEKIGELRFDENTSFMEDTLFMFKYIEGISQIYVLDEILYKQTANINSLTKNGNVEHKIEGYFYSIEKIREELKKNDIYNDNLKKLIDYRKFKIFEAELSQISSIKLLRKFLKNKDIRKNIEEIKNIKKRYKFFNFLYKTNSEILLYSYILIRKYLKKIVKRS